jgi:hypothetical protein
MPQELRNRDQPEIEDEEHYRRVFEQRDNFSDQSTVGFFEVCDGGKGEYEELGSDNLRAKLELRNVEVQENKPRIRVLYVENPLLSVSFALS